MRPITFLVEINFRNAIKRSSTECATNSGLMKILRCTIDTHETHLDAVKNF